MKADAWGLASGVEGELLDHCYSTTDREVGGFLVGEPGKREMVGVVPALKAESGQAHLTITHEAWAEVLPIVEKRFPGKKIVGWYHTHPGFGVFLSPYDEFIQKNFFGDEGQVALVVDPLAGEQGWFVKQDDSIVEVQRETTARGPVGGLSVASLTSTSTESEGIPVAGKLLAAISLSLVVGFAGGWVLEQRSGEPSGGDAATTSALEAENDRLRGDLDAMQGSQPPAPEDSVDPPPSYSEYQVQRGDSWWGIAERLTGDGLDASGLQAANQRVDVLYVGQTVLIPMELVSTR